MRHLNCTFLMLSVPGLARTTIDAVRTASHYYSITKFEFNMSILVSTRLAKLEQQNTVSSRQTPDTLAFTRCFGSSHNFGLRTLFDLVLSGSKLTGIFYGHVSNAEVLPSPCQLTVVVV